MNPQDKNQDNEEENQNNLDNSQNQSEDEIQNEQNLPENNNQPIVNNNDDNNPQNETTINNQSENHQIQIQQNLTELEQNESSAEEQLIQLQINYTILRRLEEYHRMRQLFINENYLKDLKREFLKFKIFFFHENNQNYTELTDSFLNQQFEKFKEDILQSLDKTFEAFDEQEINFKIDRLYKWNRIVQSNNIDFFIFYREDKLKEKEDKILSDNFCYTLVHPTPIKELLPSYSHVFNDVDNLAEEKEFDNKKSEIGCQYEEPLKSEDEKKEENKPNLTKSINHQSKNTLKANSEENEKLLGKNQIENTLSFSFNKPLNVNVVEKIIVQTPDGPKTRTLDELIEEARKIPSEDIKLVSRTYYSMDKKPEKILTSKNINNELKTGIQKLITEPSFKIDTNKGFDEFFNINTNEMSVADEYKEKFLKLISEGEYLSFPINNEFIMLLKPKHNIDKKLSKVLQYPLLLKSSILPYLSTTDFLVLRMANKPFQDIIKSVWHTIYKQEISEQVMIARILKYVI